MSKEVRNIFIILIGTMVLIVGIAVFVEYENSSLVGIQISQRVKTCAEKALDLFSQETYKIRDSEDGSTTGGAVGMSDIYDCNGNLYVSGKFYGNLTDTKDIYDSIYKKVSFINWCDGTDVSGKVISEQWYNLDLLNRRLNRDLTDSSPSAIMPDYSTILAGYPDTFDGYNQADIEYNNLMDKYTEYSIAKAYEDTLVTPMNLGIPYMDSEIVTRMFRWNIAMLFSECNPALIILDENGIQCIQKDGFRLYAQFATIDIRYQIFDLENPTEAYKFKAITNIDPSELSFTGASAEMEGSGDERTKICLLGVSYSIPVSYVGITPISSIFSAAWDNEVEGLNGAAPDYGDHELNTNASNLIGGGFDGVANAPGNTLPVPGDLVYYIVR